MARMPPVANPEDERKLAAYAAALVAAVDAVIEDWVVRCVERRLREWSGTADPSVLQRAREAAAHARREVIPEIEVLLALDVDDQRSNPLTVLRRAVRYPTEVLAAAGVPPVRRDDFEERAFPDDLYGLSPASFADVDPSLHEPGLEWGAAKAHVHLSRRR